MMLTLDKVKKYLNIDFNDNDEYLQSLLDASKERASAIMGIPQTVTVVDDLGNESIIDNPDFDNDEVNNAILNDIAFAYQSRGEKESTSASATETYRRRSVRPML
jgi:hypothetical protein